MKIEQRGAEQSARKSAAAPGAHSKAFPGPGTGPLSGPGRGFTIFSGIRVLTGPGLSI